MGREAGSKGGARWRSRLGVGAAMMVLGCLIAVGSGSGAGADYPPGQYIVLEKTVIPGDDPFACPGINGTDELVVGDGVPVVYCFRVVNTDSNVKLCSVEVVDYLLAINQDDMTLVEGDDTVGLPPGPQVGEAWRYLKELRLDSGPLSRDEAEAALRSWWAQR